MRINKLKIENFRSIRAIELELGQDTVFIGQNNAGKTAILDAVRIALTRRWGQRGTGFTEYDIHLQTDQDDPKKSPGLAIEVTAEESEAGEWPEELQQALENVIQVDAVSGRAFVILRARCVWDANTESFEPSWEFLNAARQPLAGSAARRLNLERFWRYLPVFYLGALRDVGDEFSPRSQFWGRLLRAMRIPAALEAKSQRVLDLLNRKLLAADARLGEIAQTLSGATRVASRDRSGAVNLRLMPLNTWDLLSKAEIILRNEPDWPWLPLQKHGQGMQSLSVIFLFQAFVEHLLQELYEPESAAVLALEEPETHLHPQAARNLWTHVNALPGQKLITTHSPYFVQHVPFRDLRLVRLTERGTEISWLPPSFSAVVPAVPPLLELVGNSAGALVYDAPTQTLSVNGKLGEQRFRDIAVFYGEHPDRAAILDVLKDLQTRSEAFIDDDELNALETFARRIRGEIFFASRWMIVEGQAEYLIVSALAKRQGYDFDEHGVSLIDAVNNGNPGTFAALARALKIPFLAVFDGDQAGMTYCRTIGDRGFPPAFVSDRCKTLPDGNLEQQLVADGLGPALRDILTELGQQDAQALAPVDLEKRLARKKTEVAAALAVRIADDAAFAARMPLAFREAIGRLRGLT
ncbi:AAA family ATPase [Mesorhizobium sp. B3-1-9]|uniref:ATP-dependent nuclease n=1 Tax=Mesorhizobium sp. B3-1-9 TaxID=2589892 RepID=UPI0015E3D30B|nr:AAA family ATPase [Mesorhizobium sp. B3-1-9]